MATKKPVTNRSVEETIETGNELGGKHLRPLAQLNYKAQVKKSQGEISLRLLNEINGKRFETVQKSMPGYIAPQQKRTETVQNSATLRFNKN